MVTSRAKGSRSVGGLTAWPSSSGSQAAGPGRADPHLPCSLSGPGLSLHPSSARPETAGVGGSLPAITPPTARRRRDRARRTSAGQGSRAPGLRAQAPLVTSGGATPAMLRAARGTGRSRGGPSASLSRRPGLPRGLLRPAASLAPVHSGGHGLPAALQSLIFPPSSQKRVVMAPHALRGRGAWPGWGGGFHRRGTRFRRPCESSPARFPDKWPHCQRRLSS
ncbi:hypothetical protein VULLAG_LOCUS22488 [Vulpes lagopus]